MKTQSTLEHRIGEILSRDPAPDHDYYALVLLADEEGKIWRSIYSHWEGYADEECRIELRAASLVQADYVAETWRKIGESCFVVNSLSDMEIFFLLGGNALVEKTVAEASIGDWLRPRPTRIYGLRGFLCAEGLPQTAFHRAPTPKLRMKIIQRDDYRCRICGRRATDYVDLELHVHHIRPWASRGLTEEGNLITLCHTCHNGLDPHFNPSLFDLIESPTKDAAEEYWAGVRRYRELGGNCMILD